MRNTSTRHTWAAPATEDEKPSRSSLSTTQRLAAGSFVISLIGLYYKREEHKAVFSKKTTAPQPAPQSAHVRYLYQPGELEGGGKRATDPIWSLKVYTLERAVSKQNEPVLYYLHNGPKRGFVREELLATPPDTVLLSINAN